MSESAEDPKGLAKRLLNLNTKAKKFLGERDDWYLRVNESKKIYVLSSADGRFSYSSEDLKSWTDPDNDEFFSFSDYGKEFYTLERMTAMEILKDLLTFECKIFRGPYVKMMYGDRIVFED